MRSGIGLFKYFKAPVFEGDEEKTYQAYLLNVLLWVLVFVPIPYVAYILINAPELAGRAWVQTFFGELVNFFLLFLLQRGHIRVASQIQTHTFWLFFTVTAFTARGVQDEAYLFGYPLVILITGLLLGSRQAIWMTALCLTSGLVMTIAEYLGSFVSQPNHPLLTWVISLALFPVMATLQYLTGLTTKKAIERAQQSEERYRLISRVSSDYAFESRINDKDLGETVWLAGAFEKMTGYTPEEYIEAGGWYGHIHPDDLARDEEDMKKLLNNQDVLGSEVRTYAKNGEIRWERIFAHPIWSEKENRLVGILGAVQDITERKEAEKKLQELLYKQNAILDNIPDMAWMKDYESRYIAVNEEFLHVSGLKREDVVGKTDFEIWEKDFAEMYSNDDLMVMQSGVRKTVEELQRDSAGMEYWVETTKTPIRDEKGNVIGTTGIARNISERKAAEMERDRFIAELGAKNAELERFTYTVSHDLKSPLVTITGFLGYLERDARAGKFETFDRDLDRIQQAVDKMQTLLNDLLELSRIGRIINEPEEFEFRLIVRDVLALLDGSITAQHVRIEYKEDETKMMGDRLRLMEVMQNLVENAIKFMGEQPDPMIHIGVTKDTDGKSIFFVKDNGVGIEPAYKDRIFGLFNKLDPGTEGSGIGLTLVKRIIEVHKGKIWVESQPGNGTTFYFNLPERS